MTSRYRPWQAAWADAAYSAGGFWQVARPRDHFATASSSTSVLSALVAALLEEHPEVGTVVELGAGDAALLAQLAGLRPDLSLTGVDLRERPGSCPDQVGWCRDLWDVDASGWTTGSADRLLHDLAGPALVLCVEWLDDLPCAVATRVQGTLRLVEVATDGRERVGAAPGPDAADWCHRWSPWAERLEVGLSRDRAWAAACGHLRRRGGLALLVDYGHLAVGRPAGGSLVAYQAGRRTAPRPSPGVNLTAAVAVDSVEQAGRELGAVTLLRARQSQVVAAAPAEHVPDPLADLVQRSQRSALTSPAVWGSHWWLLQRIPAGAPPDR